MHQRSQAPRRGGVQLTTVNVEGDHNGTHTYIEILQIAVIL